MEDVSTFYIDYGKYRYYYSEDVFIGCENPTQEFIEFYFKSCFEKLSSYKFSHGTDNKAQYSLHVTSFKMMPNNQIVIELNSSEIKQSSSYVSDLNFALIKTESFPDKNIFGSVNELILAENKKREEYNDDMNKKYEAIKNKIKSFNSIEKKYSALIQNWHALSKSFRELLDGKLITDISDIDVTNESLNEALGLQYGSRFEAFSENEHEAIIIKYINLEFIKGLDRNYISPIRNIISNILEKKIAVCEKKILSHTHAETEMEWIDLSKAYKPSFELFADPFYILWMLETNSSYMVSRDLISYDKVAVSNFFNGIELTHVSENLYIYKLKMLHHSITVPKKIVDMNEARKKEEFDNIPPAIEGQY